MSLHDHVTSALPDLRREAEAMMVDQVRFTVPGDGEPVFDPSTGSYTHPEPAVVYSGSCQVQVPQAQPRDLVVGDDPIVVDRATIKIPVGSPDVPIGAVGEVVAVGPVSDPALVGQRFRVVGSFAKTYASARRLPCERVQGG